MPTGKQQALVSTTSALPVVRVVAYVRMSTEHQRYSVFNQLALITEYAAARHFALVRTYADEGISGLQVRNRGGFKKLIADVVAGNADFSKVLVYDVSRW